MKEQRLSNLEKSIEKLLLIEFKIKRKSGKTGLIRAILFFSIIILLPVSYLNFSLTLSLVILIPIIISFVIVSIIQSNLLNYLKLLQNWLKIKKSFISRINIDWDNIEPCKLPDNVKQKLIETDLDLTGERSLHQLIDCSVTTQGSLLLREFMINHDINEGDILLKQNIVKEILGLNRFREKFLLTISLLSKNKLDPTKFVSWLGNNVKAKYFNIYLIIVTILAMTNLIFVGLAIAGIIPIVWTITMFFYLAFYSLGNKYYKGISGDADLIKTELGKYSKILEFLENFNFGKNEILNTIVEPLKSKSERPSIILNKANRVVSILTFRANPFVWGAAIVIFPLDFYLSYFLEKYKYIIRRNIKSWLNIWYKLEAHVSIANFSYLNPDYNFPEISKTKFEFNARELGHPLIQFQNRVNNSFEIKNVGEAYIITGSNMSGKSTFLRTLGINTCLAYAGAPVDAKSFSLSALQIFSCIKVSDSVIDGISYFYSEVKRLKELLDLINDDRNKPVLYLVDEIFKGTNNIERRIGSSAFIKSLIGKNCAGLISTHDIELVKLADENKLISNFHFKEEIQKDKMVFDYKLREGPCPTTNALKIMEIEGLPVN